MKASYRQKLFLSFVLIFTLFTAAIIFFEQSREKEHRTEALEEKLDAFAGIVYSALSRTADRRQTLDSLPGLFPENIRLTLIDRQGHVIYDNAVEEAGQMENHARRPEIRLAREKGRGRDIRISSSNNREYLYYARQFSDCYIRIALPYDIKVRHFLKPDNIFLYCIAALFVVMLALINLVSGQFGKSIRQLRDFSNLIENGNARFPDDELGEIGTKIADNYRKLKESEKAIALEREKLLQHVHSSEEGLCFFSPGNAVEFYNGLFIQYLNTITDEADSNPASVLTDASFGKISAFLSGRDARDSYFETHVDKHGKTFAVRANVFDDRSFEIIINDVTKQEKTQRLKQEMTGNITHELRTPVTGIRGCLETILEHPLSPEKKDYFIRSAYRQTLALSELISDMSLITRIEEAPHTFDPEDIVVADLLENLKKELEIPLQEKDAKMTWNIGSDVTVRGNRNLIYAIFRNLTDNAVRHAGSHIGIFVSRYAEDAGFHYFSYSDTGVGISGEQHLNRIFERFYRIGEGRTRDTGGTGLGLSIVKNAVAFHRGTIVAKNRVGGGLEFLFKLPKSTAK
ncbi:MAG: HAMP domain-containing histidine kinase [Tannerella sp.]|jgi:signal transduction histidine kinase|nr:HAMP domain-containing histidine kinase [Tannerella sp.]